MAILYILAAAVFTHAVIGTAIMLDFMRRPGSRPWWQPLPMREFFQLWLVFAFAWSLAMVYEAQTS